MLQFAGTSLTALDLSANEITTKELQILNECVQQNSKLSSIDLRNNKFNAEHDEEARAALDAIKGRVQSNEVSRDEA
eukprot:scaffold438_cov250-Pinguiococcus_pyrenoidosus.AAC.42